MQSDNLRQRFRFRLGLSLAVLPVLLLLLVLGVWQVQRHFWKQALIAEMAVSTDQQACPLPAALAGPTSTGELAISEAEQDDECDRYYLNGTIDPASIFLMGSDRVAGIPGRYAMAYLSLSDQEGGIQGLWLRLGFVPENKYRVFPDIVAAYNRHAGAASAFVLVLKSAGWTGPNWAKPVNDPTRGLWAYVDIAQMNAYFGVEAPFFADRYGHVVEGPDIDGLSYFEPVSRVPNNHWHYALTWFSLALILSAIWFLMSREAINPNVSDNTNE